VGRDPVYTHMKDELVELVGREVYAMVSEYLEAQVMAARKGKAVRLAHPAVRNSSP
jgi:hypothetical protein